MFVAITLVAVGFGELAFLIRRAPIDTSNEANVVAYLTCLSFIFAGLFTPFKMTFRGFVIGFFLGITIAAVLSLILPAVQ